MKHTITMLVLTAGVASAQQWQPVLKPQAPAQPTPQQLPASVLIPQAVSPPKDEKLTVIDQRSLRIQYLANRLVLTNNNTTFRSFDPLSGDAEATKKLLNDLIALRWGTIGISRVVVEYGLTVDGRGELIVPPNAGFPRSVTPFDLKSLRVESIRGVWCMRDDSAVLLNFGLEKQEAERAVAVCKKYGFNRIGTVGKGRVPAVTYFIAATEATIGAQPNTPADLKRDIVLDRTGIDVPGLGYHGEKIAIEARKLEVRRERSDVSLRMGSDVLARFGSDEWGARDAVRAIQDGRFTEFCRVGSLTFFLVQGKPPVNVPFLAKSRRFDPGSLRMLQMNQSWVMLDAGGRPLMTAESEKAGNEAIMVIKAFGFDTLATIGSSPTNNLQFLAKSR